MPVQKSERLEADFHFDPSHLLRVEAARREIERTQKGLKQVASAAGFGNVDVMRRAFVRLLGLTPGRYSDVAARSTSG